MEEVESARDLACLGQTCQFMSDLIEDFCYREVTIHSPAGLVSLCESLLSSKKDRFGYTRSQRLRFLSISWHTTTFSLPRVRDDVDRIFLRAPNIAHLSIDIPMSDRRPVAWPLDSSMTDKISLRHARALVTLFATGPAIHQLCGPTPKLTILSVDMGSALNASILTSISYTFGNTLERLRLFRDFHSPYTYTQQSPARVCGALYAPKLKHLEIWDRATIVRAFLLSHTSDHARSFVTTG